MIALYPGAFKPPHRGHFEVVKRLLKGNHGGHTYNKDSGPEAGAKALAGQSSKVEKIDKVVVFPGGGERNGITKEQSLAIWKIYAKHLPGLEVLDGQKNPMFAAKDYAAANPDEKFYAVTGVRDESDFADLRRITTFSSTPNVEGLVMGPDTDSNIRATDLRKAILSGNLDQVQDFFPKELTREEILHIVRMLKDIIIAEELGQKLEDVFEAWFPKSIKEGSSGTPIAPTSAERSVDRHIRQENNKLAEYIASLLGYMLDQGMNILPLPEVKIIKDEQNADNFFGTTAHYDSSKNEIALYTIGRHNKDIVRSFAHEMIHHIQNLEGRLTNISTTNTNADSNLLELEKEAYLLGNITFRNWEDSIKNPKPQVAENSYKSEVLGIARDFINVFKESFGKKFDHNSYGELPGGQTSEFDIDFHVKPVKSIGNHPYSIHAEGDEDSIEIWVEYVKAAFPAAYNDFIAEIKEAIRHEMEHVAQQVKGTAPFEAHGTIPFYMYLLLTHEIPAYVQGLRTRARTKKITLEDAIDQYFNEYTDSFDKEEEKDLVKKQWLDWAAKNK